MNSKHGSSILPWGPEPYLLHIDINSNCQNCLAAEETTYHFLGICVSWGYRRRKIWGFTNIYSKRTQASQLGAGQLLYYGGWSTLPFIIEGMGNRGWRKGSFMLGRQECWLSPTFYHYHYLRLLCTIYTFWSESEGRGYSTTLNSWCECLIFVFS